MYTTGIAMEIKAARREIKRDRDTAVTEAEDWGPHEIERVRSEADEKLRLAAVEVDNKVRGQGLRQIRERREQLRKLREAANMQIHEVDKWERDSILALRT